MSIATKTLTPEQLDGLATARDLISMGVPVFRATPGGNVGGFTLPTAWQTTALDPTVLDHYRPGDALCAVTGHGLDLIDVDPQNGGRIENLPTDLPTVYAVASTPSGGTHYFVRSLGIASRDSVAEGIDVKAGHGGHGHGFAFIAPTVKASKVTGLPEPYVWTQQPTEPKPDDDTGAPLREHVETLRHTGSTAVTDLQAPADDFAGLDRETQRRVQRWTTATVEGIRSDLEAAQTWTEGQRDGSGRGWERLCADAAWRLARLALTPWCPLTVAEAQHVFLDHAPTDGGEWTTGKVREKWNAQAARAKRHGPYQWQEGFDAPGFDADEILGIEDDSTDPDEFWSRTAFLQAVATFALSRNVSRMSLLGGVLLRVSASVSPLVVLPPLIGGVAPLNLFVAYCSESGEGKTAADMAAEEFLTVVGAHQGYLRSVPSSGEGVSAAFSSGHVSALLNVDEITSLGGRANRNGSTIVPTLTTAWSGGDLSTLNAERTRNREVPSLSYRLALSAGVQPTNAGEILRYSGTGFPQRWLWLPTYDEALLRDDLPTEADGFEWHVPSLPVEIVGDPQGDFEITTGQVVMTVAPIIRETILTARRERMRPIGVAAPANALDGHALQTRERVAALFALLDGRFDVTEADWSLAGELMGFSDATRALVMQALGDAQARENTARGRAEGLRTVAAAEVVESEKVKAAGRWALTKLQAEDDGLTRSELRKKAASSNRQYLDDALEALEKSGQIVSQEIDGQGQSGTRYLAVTS